MSEYLNSHELYLNDLYEVGKDKPLGYLPVETIVYHCGQRLDEVIRQCSLMGLSTLLQTEEEARVYSGALHAYDPEALKELLAANATLLARYDWPIDPLEFIKQIGVVTADIDEDPELYALIAWAYRDPRPEYQRPIATVGQPVVPIF